VWVATGQGGAIVRLDGDDGSITERVDAVAPFVSSLCLGGLDGRDVVVTTAGGDSGGTVWRGRAPVAGVRVPAAVI
jgi:sugar lactone lactonase YvrE